MGVRVQLDARRSPSNFTTPLHPYFYRNSRLMRAAPAQLLGFCEGAKSCRERIDPLSLHVPNVQLLRLASSPGSRTKLSGYCLPRPCNTAARGEMKEEEKTALRRGGCSRDKSRSRRKGGREGVSLCWGHHINQEE